LTTLNKEVDNLKIEILKDELDFEDLNREKTFDTYDIQIKGILEAIGKIRKDIVPKELRVKELTKNLAKANDSLSKKISESLSVINLYFEEYAQKYFRPDCKLTIDAKQLKKSNNFDRIRQSHYIPFFGNKKRTLTKHCSTSQRFFLEYIFRLSLLELYKSTVNEDRAGFAIFETTEGAFDLKFTERLASAFLDYSTNNDNPLILIVNLSKPEFVSQLKEGMSDSNNILNYIDFGNLNAEDKSFYEEKIKEYNL